MSPTLKNEVIQALSQASQIGADVVAGFQARLDEVAEKVERRSAEAAAAVERRSEKAMDDFLKNYRDDRKEDMKRFESLQSWQNKMIGVGLCVSLLMGVCGTVCAGLILSEVKEVQTQIWKNRPGSH